MATDQTKDPAEDFNCPRNNRPCFVCGTMMVEDYPRKDHNPLQANWHNATDWTTYGNWCSKKHDGMLDPNYPQCHIVVCDDCFEDRKDRIVKIEYSPEQKKKNEEERRIAKEKFREWWNRDGGSQLKKE